MEITILCKVVDNYGDIGVVWRLCRQLKKINSENKLNLVVDNLASFKNIWSSVEVNKSFQVVNDINVYDWNNEEYCYDQFGKKNQKRLQVILECFQCGRPDWLEKILFDEELDHTVQIIMIDYLTAEPYAESFHKLKSLTRKAKVQKVNFMPGFTAKTGGLILDEPWNELPLYKDSGPVLFFTYEKSETFWQSVFSAFVRAGFKNEILAAQGKGFASFVKAYESFYASKKLKVRKLDFCSQNEWDELTRQCSILFIRGEESMSRACLSGIPFVWQAYPQSDEYQMVKMNLLLERMSLHFTDEHLQIIKRVWNVFNSSESELVEKEVENSVYDFLKVHNQIQNEYSVFSKSLFANGDLAVNLMTFINQICII